MDIAELIEMHLEALRLGRPGDAWVVMREVTVERGYLASDDGYREAGSYEAQERRQYLVVGARRVDATKAVGGQRIFVTAESSKWLSPDEAKDKIKMRVARDMASAVRHLPADEAAEQLRIARQEAQEIWQRELAVLDEEYRGWLEAKAEYEGLVKDLSALGMRMSRIGMAEPQDGWDRPDPTTMDYAAVIPTLRRRLVDWQEMLAHELDRRGMVAAETAARNARTAEERRAAIERAVAGEAPAVPWLLLGVPPEALAKWGRKEGEGFGKSIEGDGRYMPGDLQLVGVAFPRQGGKRYATEISTEGVEPLSGASLPSSFCGSEGRLLGLVEPGSDWFVASKDSKDGQAYQWHLVNGRGWATLDARSPDSPEAGDDGMVFRSSGWSGGEGPSEAELRSVWGMPQRRAVATFARSVERQEPARQEPATMADLAAKFGKRRK
jgi:hypothetical protein